MNSTQDGERQEFDLGVNYRSIFTHGTRQSTFLVGLKHPQENALQRTPSSCLKVCISKNLKKKAVSCGLDTRLKQLAGTYSIALWWCFFQGGRENGEFFMLFWIYNIRFRAVMAQLGSWKANGALTAEEISGEEGKKSLRGLSVWEQQPLESQKCSNIFQQENQKNRFIKWWWCLFYCINSLLIWQRTQGKKSGTWVFWSIAARVVISSSLCSKFPKKARKKDGQRYW